MKSGMQIVSESVDENQTGVNRLLCSLLQRTDFNTHELCSKSHGSEFITHLAAISSAFLMLQSKRMKQLNDACFNAVNEHGAHVAAMAH